MRDVKRSLCARVADSDIATECGYAEIILKVDVVPVEIFWGRTRCRSSFQSLPVTLGLGLTLNLKLSEDKINQLARVHPGVKKKSGTSPPMMEPVEKAVDQSGLAGADFSGERDEPFAGYRTSNPSRSLRSASSGTESVDRDCKEEESLPLFLNAYKRENDLNVRRTLLASLFVYFQSEEADAPTHALRMLQHAQPGLHLPRLDLLVDCFDYLRHKPIHLS